MLAHKADKSIPKGMWEKRREITTKRIPINYHQRFPRITKSVEAWLIKYCRTDLISIKLKDLDL